MFLSVLFSLSAALTPVHPIEKTRARLRITEINLIKFFGNQSLYNISTQTSERTNYNNSNMN